MALSADPTKPGSSVEAASEITPLLGASESGGPVNSKNEDSADDDQTDVEERPMPHVQILLLCAACLVEPIAYFGIFPFINQMIERTGDIDEKDVGFWSGMIESLFSLVQMVLMIFYGRLADRMGRKPVLIWSLAGVSVCTAIFGLSQSLWQMILLRCLAGTFAGSAVTIRTMISENCTKETQGRAFGWYMFTRNLGLFIGPLVGGGLANPATQFPRIFGSIALWRQYPYLLSCIVCGVICLIATILNMLLLKETLEPKGSQSPTSEPPLSTWEVLNSPGVPMVLYIFAHVMAIGLAFTAVSPIAMYTSVKNGGFGMSPQQISYMIALAGISQALWMLLVFPSLQRRYGTGAVLRSCAYTWPLFMCLYPLSNELLRRGWTTPFWAVFIPFSVLGSGVAMAFACVQLCLNDISPSHSVLATVNALALTANSAVRAVVPALFTSIFATGVKLQWAHGHLVWFVIVAMALGVVAAVQFLPAAAEGKINTNPAATSHPSDGEADEV